MCTYYAVSLIRKRIRNYQVNTCVAWTMHTCELLSVFSSYSVYQKLLLFIVIEKLTQYIFLSPLDFLNNMIDFIVFKPPCCNNKPSNHDVQFYHIYSSEISFPTST